MFNLVRFTLDGVYFVCKTKDLKRKGKKTSTKWLDKKLYEVDIITTSQSRKALEDICANLNSNVPRILLEKFVEDLMVIHSSSENVDEQCTLEKNMENSEECIRCGHNCNLKDHVCSFIARENSFEDKMSHDDEEIQLCSNSGLLDPNLKEHLHLVHGSSDMSEIVEDKMSHDDEEIQLCSNSGLLGPNLKEHLHLVHGSSDKSEIVEDKMSHDDEEIQLCSNSGLLGPNLKEHLHLVHGSSDKSEIDNMSHDGDEGQLCTSCGLLCSNLEEHLHTVHGSSMSEIVENSEVSSSEDFQLCQFCGLVSHQLNEHLRIEHGSAEYVGDIVEVHMQENPKTYKYKTKQHFCVYCQTLHFKLARHLENKHHLEEDVQEAFRYNKGSSQRKKLFLEIQKKGDFLYNTRHEDTISQRRGYNNSPALIPCPYCRGYYKKSYLRNHVRLHCIMKSAERKDKFETDGLSNLITKSRSIVPCALPTANDILKSRIFPTMTENENYMSLIDDDLGTKYGNYLTTKYSSSQHHDKMIKAKLRQLSRLFLEMRKLNQNIVNMTSIFDPANFDYFIQAIYNMAGLKDGKFETPSLGPSTVTLILDVGTVLETDTIVRKDEKMERDCKRFCKLIKTKCNSLINKLALENKTQNQRCKTVKLPKTNDIKELVDSLEIEIQNCKSSIKDEFNQQTWIILNKLVLIRMMVYNRKRPGDVEKSRMIEYRNIEILNEEQIQHLQGSEKESGISYGRYITRGKLDRPAAVLVSRADMEAIDLILKYRKSANVEDRNPYLFATPCGTAEQFFKGGKALKDFCIAKKFCHKTLTATNMRKHLATVTCTFGKEEQMQVSDFMGHAFNIHQNIYRQRPASLDIVGMSKLLDFASGSRKQDATDLSFNTSSNIPVLAEHERLGGTSSEGPATSRGGIPATSNEGIPGTSREGLPETSTEETDLDWLTPCRIESSDEGECTSPKANEDDTSDEDFSPYSSEAGQSSRHGKLQQRVTTKKTWSTPEKFTMRTIFKNYLEGHANDIPSLETCQHFTFENSVLSSRSTSQIRSWIVQEKRRRQSGSKSGWPTPLRNRCREKFRNFYLTGKYPPTSKMLEVIRESPEHNLTVPKLRSHLQHDLKYASSQKMLGRKLF